MFIPRHPVVENQFCKFGETSNTNGAGNVVCYAGAVLYLDSTATNQEAVVKLMEHGVSDAPFGFSMQKVKTGYHSVHPVGMVMPGDLGSSDVIAQPKYDSNGNINGTQTAPLGVAHLGIWDTVHYTCTQAVAGTVSDGAHMKPGQSLFPAAQEARLTNSTTDSDGSDTQGERCSTTVVARVLSGASAAKCTANIGNTTLYPIKVKLLV